MEEKISKEEFVQQVKTEAVRVGDKMLATTGTGRATRYHIYAADEVLGFDQIRNDDGEMVSNEVANHEDAVSEDIKKSELDEWYKEFVEQRETMEEKHGPDEFPEPSDESIQCVVCGDELSYITGSHLKIHEDNDEVMDVTTVEEYRRFAASNYDIEESEVPLMSGNLMTQFKEQDYGNDEK